MTDIKKTNKNDWANNFLAKNNIVVSSHLSNVSHLGLENIELVFRFIAFKNHFLFFVTLDSVDTKTIRELENGIKHKAYFKKSFNCLSGFFILLYSPEKFLICDDFNNPLFRTVDLLNYLQSLAYGITSDVGSSKMINKSTNDFFQDWTRSNLSKKCIINDIDGLYLSPERSIIFELKKPKENISSWLPYNRDKPNYLALISLTKLLNAELRIVAYNIDRDDPLREKTVVAFHYDLNLDGSGIRGKKTICRPLDILTTAPVPLSVFETATDYLSTR
jgi:hypothetical protein